MASPQVTGGDRSVTAVAQRGLDSGGSESWPELLAFPSGPAIKPLCLSFLICMMGLT